ncbi:Hint domain-containing protein [Phaeovulum sp.]|uniref:Hint domain-containing protein n=1 Tax=Phaeovulum sp. TaxID=2934796 RepID=UPI0039E21CEA
MGSNNKENISEVSGNFTNSEDGFDTWTFDASLADLTVEGDFDLDTNLDGVGGPEASDGYTFTALNTSAYGSLSYNTTTGKFTFTIDKAAVIASGSDQVISFTVTGYSGNKSDPDKVQINIAICVQRGTLIKTAHGEVAVEELEPGDQVLTLDSGYQPIRWIGSRKLGRSDLDHAPALRPIRIGKGALGPDSPVRDLIVSPQHRVLLSGWKAELYFGAPEILVPAKSLVNDIDIRVARDIDDVEYFHVLFDRHEIMMTNGAPTESFFPGDYVLDELNTAVLDELTAIFPDLLANPAGFGYSARPSVRPSEAVVLRSRLLH